MQKLIRRGPLAAFSLGLVGLCGCQSPEFVPVDAEPTTPLELAAEWQDLSIGDRDLGGVKVWSPGRPEPPAVGADDDRQVEVAMRIRNDGPETLRLDLDATRLEVHSRDDHLHVLRQPLEVRGPTAIPPGAVHRVELIYALPEKLSRLIGFELAWVITAPAPAHGSSSGEGTLPAGAERDETDDGSRARMAEHRISRSSVFRRVLRETGWDYYPSRYPYRWGYPYYDYYDPWYGPYGFHFGYGYRWGW